MIKETVKYVDFEGNTRQETLYFNLTEPEAVRLDAKVEGGLEKYVASLDEKVNPERIVSLFETVILDAYGEKDVDGRYFIKNEEIRQRFLNSAAYAALFMSLVKDADKAAAFFNSLVTRTVVEK